MRNVLGTAPHHTCGDSLWYRPTFSLLFNRVGKNEFTFYQKHKVLQGDYILGNAGIAKMLGFTLLGTLTEKCWDFRFPPKKYVMLKKRN